MPTITERLKEVIRGLRTITKESTSNSADFVLQRPVDSYVPMQTLGAIKTPIYFIPFRLSYDLAYNSDILRTIIRALISETFRNGIRVRPAYARKCAVCGATYHESVNRCKICGSTEFIEPNEVNAEYLRKILRDANLNNDSLIEVLQAIDWDLNVVDNAYLVVLKKYYFDDNGDLMGAEPLEVLRADPRWMSLIMSRDGRLGYDDDGNIKVFCLEHRDELHDAKPEDLAAGKVRCPKCGKKMFPAYFMYRKWGKRIYYTNGEVLHIKKFTYGTGYGYPPVMSIWMKLMILLRQDYFILIAYHLQRSPRGLLVIKTLNRESVEKAWQVLMEKARINPHIVYPLVVESDTKKGGNIAEWVDLSYKSDDINFIEYRSELRRSISALYGVSPIFMSESAGAGKDSMQVLVTNRAVEAEQRLFNEKILPWLVKQLGVDDWKIELVPNEMRDELTQIKIIEEKLNLAEKLKQFGYKPKIVFDEVGNMDVVIVPQEPEEMEKEVIESTANPTKDIKQQYRDKYYNRSMKTQEFEGAPEATRPRIGQQSTQGQAPPSHEPAEGTPVGGADRRRKE